MRVAMFRFSIRSFVVSSAHKVAAAVQTQFTSNVASSTDDIASSVQSTCQHLISDPALIISVKQKVCESLLREGCKLSEQAQYHGAAEKYISAHKVIHSVTAYIPPEYLDNMFRVYSFIGNKDALRELVTANVEYFKTYKDQDTGNTALHILVGHRMYDTAKLIATDENCRAKNNDRYTPLHIAFQDEALSFVQDILPVLDPTLKPSIDDVMSSIIRTAPYADDYFMDVVGQVFDTNE
jgi:hypothetical protein